MSVKLESMVLAAAYAPLLAMTLLWLAALILRLTGRKRLLDWLTTRTSVPLPEPNPPPAAYGENPSR